MRKEITRFVGARIRYYRKINRMTQKQLGERVDVQHNTISSYENGNSEADYTVLFKIAQNLDISINDLFPPISIVEDITMEGDQDEIFESGDKKFKLVEVDM